MIQTLLSSDSLQRPTSQTRKRLRPMDRFLVYSAECDFRLPGSSWLHPFDGRKYSRAWNLLLERFGARLESFRIDPGSPVSHEDLLRMHSPGYVASLRWDQWQFLS